MIHKYADHTIYVWYMNIGLTILCQPVSFTFGEATFPQIRLPTMVGCEWLVPGLFGSPSTLLTELVVLSLLLETDDASEREPVEPFSPA